MTTESIARRASLKVLIAKRLNIKDMELYIREEGNTIVFHLPDFPNSPIEIPDSGNDNEVVISIASINYLVHDAYNKGLDNKLKEIRKVIDLHE